MAATVISGLITRALAECGGRDDFSAADQLAYYNHGNRLICRLANLREMRTLDTTTMNTADGAYAVTLPANCKTIVDLVLEDTTSSRQLVRRPTRWFDKQWADPDASGFEGRPLYYCRRVYTDIEHYPVADAAYDMHVDYYAWPTVHAAITENANFNDMDDVLVESMKYYVFKRIGERDKMKGSLEDLRVMLGSVVASENELVDASYEAETYGDIGGSALVEDHLNPYYPPT